MIEYTESDILDDTSGLRKVVLHLIPCYPGNLSGLSSRINKKFDNWYSSIKEICCWFTPDNLWNARDFTDEIRGKFHSYRSSETMIVCSALTVRGGRMRDSYTDIDLWREVLEKLRLQILNKNTVTKEDWTIHIQKSIGSQKRTETNEELLDLFNEFFSESPVKLVIHE